MPGYQWGPSGGFRVVYEYANRLVSRGHQVTVVHPRQLKYVVSHERLSIRGWARNRVNGVVNRISTPSVDWLPMDRRVRLLFVPSSDGRFIPDGDALFATAWQTVASVLKCALTKGEKLNLIQGYGALLGPKELVDATWRAPLRKIVISKWLIEIGRDLGCHELAYIPNAVDHQRYRLIQAIEDRPRQIAMLFSPAPIKGSADGIEALQIARERYPDLKVVFFGTSRPQSWIPTWARYYRNPAQEFLINSIYSKSSIFLSPSLSEGFALPPAEAGACGCAIVATDSGGIRDFIHNEVTGLLSPPKNPRALAENLCRLLGDDNLRVQLARACHSFVGGLNWERSTDLLEDLIIRTGEQNAGLQIVPS